MKYTCSLKVNKHRTAKIQIDLEKDFSRAVLDEKLKLSHPWFWKNRDRLTIERTP